MDDLRKLGRDRLKMSAVGRFLLKHVYERRFARDGRGSFRGVYGSFAEANLAAPKTKPLGFDNELYAQEFADRRCRVFSFDYPMLFWLDKLLSTAKIIFDYGGHVGTHFYAYSRYLNYAPDLKWLVCDLPAITRVGAELALREGADALQFTNDFLDADGSDILIAAGSLQYVEEPPFAVLLSRLRRMPPHLLVNKLPLYDGPPFVTLQNGGVAFHPQHVFNRRAFIAELGKLGYRLVDEWDVETHPGAIPFHREKSFRWHSGLYFRRVEPSVS